MAKIISEMATDAINDILFRTFQSGNINFLIGSGASLPAIPAGGNIENDIQSLLDAGNETEAEVEFYNFLRSVQEPCNHLISYEETNDKKHAKLGKISKAIDNYSVFLTNIEELLVKRSSTIMPKKANIFTTNYDIFIEHSALYSPGLRLNDGFLRRPSLLNKFYLDSKLFDETTFSSGNLYTYKVEAPTVNLIKLHGSLSWVKEHDDITFSGHIIEAINNTKPEAVKAYIRKQAVILPRADKFRETLMERIYYEYLRLYANELDKENTLLIVFGFSFADEHILEITKRALKNSTLTLVVFSYSQEGAEAIQTKFAKYNNVLIISPYDKDRNIDFSIFNKFINCVIDYNPKEK